MFPMIYDVTAIAKAKKIIAECMDHLTEKEIKFGETLEVGAIESAAALNISATTLIESTAPNFQHIATSTYGSITGKTGANIYVETEDAGDVTLIAKGSGDVNINVNTGDVFIEMEADSFPTFNDAWDNYTSSWQYVRYWKDPFGMVHITGTCAPNTSTSNIIFTLPTGYRPIDDVAFPAVYGDHDVVRVWVEPTGIVKCITFSGKPYISLSICFRAA